MTDRDPLVETIAQAIWDQDGRGVLNPLGRPQWKSVSGHWRKKITWEAGAIADRLLQERWISR